MNEWTQYTLKLPEKSEWQMHVADIIYNPNKGQEPNWFHRKMQELILGFKWRKKNG